MADNFYLSADDRQLLQGLLDRERQQVRRPRRSEGETPLPTAPETYIALTPAGGIPGLATERLQGTGTHVLSTGTGSFGGGNTPGQAECFIYRIQMSKAVPDLIPIAGFTKTVYNLSEAAIPGGHWLIVTRDKWGDWFAVPTAVGGAGGGVTAAFSGARYYLDAIQTITSSVATAVVWPSTGLAYDVGGHLTAPSSQIFPNAVGYFLFTASVVWDNTGSPTGFRQLQLQDAGGTILDQEIIDVSVASGLGEMNQRVSTVFFHSSSFVKVLVAHDDSGSRDLVAGDGSTTFSTTFTLSFLGS